LKDLFWVLISVVARACISSIIYNFYEFLGVVPATGVKFLYLAASYNKTF
jgi:hypothetical protein